MQEREEERGNMPVPEDVGEEGLGSSTGGLGGPDEDERQEGSGGSEGSASGDDEAVTGPTKDADSLPGGGSEEGPEPGGVPQEGRVESDPDISTGAN